MLIAEIVIAFFLAVATAFVALRCIQLQPFKARPEVVHALFGGVGLLLILSMTLLTIVVFITMSSSSEPLPTIIVVMSALGIVVLVGISVVWVAAAEILLSKLKPPEETESAR